MPSSPASAARASAACSIPAASSLDPRKDLTRHDLELPPLVAKRPEVDAPAPRARITRQQLRAGLRGAHADLVAELVRIALQQRCEDLAKNPVALGAILGHPRPHRREGVGDCAGSPEPAKLRGQQVARGSESL